MNTAYQSQYWAHALTLASSGGDIAALSRSIANARVDLNPHQVDAALFALRSPFCNGVILADEVGLGKTVEAGIVLSQKWAERRRRILIIVPAPYAKNFSRLNWRRAAPRKMKIQADRKRCAADRTAEMRIMQFKSARNVQILKAGAILLVV